MSHVRRPLAALGLAAALAVGLAPVIAGSTSVTYAISGVEYAASSTVAKFAGVAVSIAPVARDDFGTWLALVNHTELERDAVGHGTATIGAGGAFSFDGRIRDIQGVFTGGSLTGGSSGCGKETFVVTGTLALVGPATGGTGLFSATLTHYRTELFRRCITYAATVKGTVTFTLP